MLSVVRNLPGLMLTMTANPLRIRAIQLQRLRAIIAHAYESTPFYRETMDRVGIKPEDIRGVEDIRYLPIISRAEVKEYFS